MFVQSFLAHIHDTACDSREHAWPGDMAAPKIHDTAFETVGTTLALPDKLLLLRLMRCRLSKAFGNSVGNIPGRPSEGRSSEIRVPFCICVKSTRKFLMRIKELTVDTSPNGHSNDPCEESKKKILSAN